MRWILEGAESVVRFREVFINKDWADFRSFRRGSERDRLYGFLREAGTDLCARQPPEAV